MQWRGEVGGLRREEEGRSFQGIVG